MTKSKPPQDPELTAKIIAHEKKQHEEAEQKRIQTMKSDLAAARQQGRMEQLSERSKKLSIINDRGEPQDVWAVSKYKAQHLINSDNFNSTVNWLTAMTNLLGSFSVLNQAIAATLDTNIVFPLQMVVVDKLFLGLVKDNIMIRPTKEFQLPNMKYDIKFNDAKVEVAPLINPKGPDEKLINKLFEAGVHTFLREKNYHLDDTTQKWVDSAGTPLNKANFDLFKAEFQSSIQRSQPKLKLDPEPEQPSPGPRI